MWNCMPPTCDPCSMCSKTLLWSEENIFNYCYYISIDEGFIQWLISSICNFEGFVVCYSAHVFHVRTARDWTLISLHLSYIKIFNFSEGKMLNLSCLCFKTRADDELKFLMKWYFFTQHYVDSVNSCFTVELLFGV